MPQGRHPQINVAIIGVGLVGSELVHQLLSIPQHVSPFRLISLSSSRQSIFNPAIPIQQFDDWKSMLIASSERTDLLALTDRLHALVRANERVAVVDNTSSDAVASLYRLWLMKGIHVVTPNKKGFSGEIDLYNDIVNESRASGAQYLNESTVGAGLPVISTLKELVGTGDEIIKIEGVFSGTMSYIFNEFSTGKPNGPTFSSIVKAAREKGYTEPHPADDLNGFDVARKLTILLRTILTHSITPVLLPELRSFSEVKTTSLIPAALEGIPTGDEFIARLPDFDAEFSRLRADASAEGKVLRFVGVVDAIHGQVKAGLEKYPVDHPFATSLGGSDNIIMFHTERYKPRPLIIQGAGAGAAVTAMGVLGDLLKLV